MIITIIKNVCFGYSFHLLDLLRWNYESRNMPDTSDALADLLNKATNCYLSSSSNQRKHEQRSAAITDNYRLPRVWNPSKFVCINAFLISHCRYGTSFVFKSGRQQTKTPSLQHLWNQLFEYAFAGWCLKACKLLLWLPCETLWLLLLLTEKCNLQTRWIIVPWRAQAAFVTPGRQSQKFSKAGTHFPRGWRYRTSVNVLLRITSSRFTLRPIQLSFQKIQQFHNYLVAFDVNRIYSLK